MLLLYSTYAAATGLIILFAALAHRRAELAERASARNRQIVDLLERTRTEMQTVLDNVPTVIYHLDADDRYLFVNRRYEELIGRPLNELIGRHVGDVFPPDVAAQLVENNREVRDSGRTMSFEERASGPDGIRVYASLKTPLLYADGLRGVLGISTDITQQKQIEQQLRDNEARLREADQRKDEFLAMLSHELRNPLAPILTAVQYLSRKSAADTGQDSGLRIIERQAKVMARLVDDLLDLSRLSRGRIELRRERVDVAVAIEDALQACRPLIDAARHELVLSLPDEPVCVDGDLVRLSQIIANLVNNAVKYTPSGGRIELTLVERPGEAAVVVSDSGIGIAPDMVPRIFEMFAQVDTSAERTRGGLGIGLTLAQQLARMHGGRIDAHSAGPNLGSTFTLSLPLAGAAAGALDDAGLPETRPAVRPLRVLVADDNLDAASSLGLLLGAQGHDVRLVHGGVAAVAAATELRPDLALLDIGMPGLNGYETAKRIRELPHGAQIRLVALTGWGQDEDRRKSLAAGFDEHLTKPVDADTLAQVLHTAAVPVTAEARRTS